MIHRGPRENTHPIRLYLNRVASQDLGEYPDWDLAKPLPKLPVPELKETLNKYLQCIKPTVSDEQYACTQTFVDEFGKTGGLGEYLQRKLIEYAESRDNWVYEFWLEDAYLNLRQPLPMITSPGMVLPRQNFEDQNSQLRFAARFISGILDYKVIVDSRLLPIDRARSREKGQPFCMEQYYRLFTSYRYPGIEKDNLVTSHGGEGEPEHIIVVRKNQFFVLEVVANSIRLSDDNIYCQLKRCVQMAEEGEKNAEALGILTAAPRNTWAAARLRLLEDPTNRSNLEAIEHCIFVICLDKAMPVTFNHQDSVDETLNNRRDEVSLALQMLHGHGSRHNSANRWFDKTMQFIIGDDGACGLCFEHSPAEGIAVVQLIEHLLAYMEELHQRKLPRMQSLGDLVHPRKLNWNIPPDVKSQISCVSSSLDRVIDDLDLYVLRFTDYGKEFPKSQNMSPDAYIQLALQLTYYKLHGRLVSTYESASIRRFRLGRIDIIRACSTEALVWCKAMTSKSNATLEEQMILLRKAIDKQTDLLVQAILGHGIDNHLLGLRQIAEVAGTEKPDFFKDESYALFNHFTFSTSQVPTTMDAFMCYGPFEPDGYGACYNPHPHYILFCVSSSKSCKDTSISSRFAAVLESSFRQMKELCLTAENPLPVTSKPSTNHNVVQNGPPSLAAK